MYSTDTYAGRHRMAWIVDIVYKQLNISTRNFRVVCIRRPSLEIFEVHRGYKGRTGAHGVYPPNREHQGTHSLYQCM